MPQSGEHNNARGSDRALLAGRIGLLGAPLIALAVYLLLPSVQGDAGGLSSGARAVAAIGTLMATLWMTEAIPLPATALLPIALFPLVGVLSVHDAAAPYAHELVFLFMGGFLLALSMQRWGLHRRIALLTVAAVGVKPARMVGGFMLASAFLSMWISNTATTIMMLPIAMSVIDLVGARLSEQESSDSTKRLSANFAASLLLGVAYAASIGGVATIIGTPPNAVLAGYLSERFDLHIGFAQWMLAAAPFSLVFLIITWFMLTRVLHPLGAGDIRGGRELIRNELRKLGPVSRGEWTALIVFVATGAAWMLRKPLTEWAWLVERLPPVARLTDAGIAVIAAVLLFVIPVNFRKGVYTLDWKTAAGLPWGVLVLFGGGLSLARAVGASGLDQWIGAQVAALGGVPVVVIVLTVIAVIVFLTELTINTATASTFVPILGGVAIGVHTDPLLLVVPATIAASCAFMMPVATPPNAIVFGSGRINISQMIRAGFLLNLIGIAIILALTYTFVAWALGVQMQGLPDWAM